MDNYLVERNRKFQKIMTKFRRQEDSILMMCVCWFLVGGTLALGNDELHSTYSDILYTLAQDLTTHTSTILTVGETATNTDNTSNATTIVNKSIVNDYDHFYGVQTELAPDFCFYSDRSLCQQVHANSEIGMKRRLLLHGGAAESGRSTVCMCRSHPTSPNSWYCCNVSDLSMITSCQRHTGNSSNWLNLHIHNMTMSQVDLSLSFFQTLQSLAITDGNITRLIKSFSRVSQIKCLDISNNNLSSISIRVPPFLKFLNISYNNLTQIPKMKQQLNITLDVRENKHMLCKPLLETIFRGSLRFVAPNSSYCLLDYNYNWFNSSDYVAISQLEMARRFHTECPVIPGKGNCTCTPEHMISTGDPAHPEAKIFCRVDCANMGLTELPSRLPENTFQLDITNNSISDIGLHFHNNPTYQSIVKLYADNNRIKSMHELEGTKFMDHFQKLYLRNNTISRLPEYLLTNVLNSYMGRVIFLGGNKLNCDCNSATVLKTWLLQRSRDIPDYNDILCRNMPQRVMELQEMKVCQSPHDWTDYIYYVICGEVLLLIALITKVSYDYWVFKTAGYLPWPANKMPKLPCDWLCES